ncbi:MAG: AraC family transcriptional regulator [Clostridiaceae bacterium]|nr:AraC family transcriptional regulator [Clostridiaceae bacterium]
MMSLLEKYYISKKDNTDLNVYRCGIEECLPYHSWGPGVRDHYIIHVILSGKGSFFVNGQTHILEAGEGFLICPGQIVSYKADSTEPWTYSWVGFHGLKAEQVLNRAGLSLDFPTFNHYESDYLVESLEKMITEARSLHPSDLMLSGLLYQFLAHLVHRIQFQEPIAEKNTDSTLYVSKATEYIEKNFASPLSVSGIASFLKIDRSYLSTLFSRHLGISPRDYIINYRINKACELLNNPLLSIGDVSRSVGYEDPLQFSKTFKKEKGVSPSRFRTELLIK